MSVRTGGRVQRSGFWVNLRTIGYAVLIALVVRTFFYQPFNIPSGSMIPNLLVGDYLFVSKYAYGYSRFSLPLNLPLFEGRLFPGELERGDVVVFRLPLDDRVDYIKRVIGLPGDRIQVKNGVIYINGEPVQRFLTENYVMQGTNGASRNIPQYRETLPNGITYRTLDMFSRNSVDNTGVFVVPEGRFFVMGDNRDNSTDSRVLNVVGYVPYENLVGRASFIFFSHDGTAPIWKVWKWPGAIRWDRLFTGIE